MNNTMDLTKEQAKMVYNYFKERKGDFPSEEDFHKVSTSDLSHLKGMGIYSLRLYLSGADWCEENLISEEDYKFLESNLDFRLYLGNVAGKYSNVVVTLDDIDERSFYRDPEYIHQRMKTHEVYTKDDGCNSFIHTLLCNEKEENYKEKMNKDSSEDDEDPN